MSEKNIDNKERRSPREKWNKFWIQVLDKISTIGSKTMYLHPDGTYRDVPPPEKENTPSVEIVTLGQNGQEFPPSVDYDDPPEQLFAERKQGVIEKLTEMWGAEAAQMIVDNIRYVDEESFFQALDQLAEHLVAQADKPLFFVYYKGSTDKEGKSTKSGKWVTEQVRKRIGQKIEHKQVSLEDLVDAVREKGKSAADQLQGYQIVIADDLINSGEQIETILLDSISKIDKEHGTHLLQDTIVSAVASRDYTGLNRPHFESIKQLVRVFGNFTIGDIEGIEDKMGAYNYSRRETTSIQFYYHKVPDYFFFDILRRRSMDDRWMVDHTAVSPPYEPDRYTTGSNSAEAKWLNEDKPR